MSIGNSIVLMLCLKQSNNWYSRWKPSQGSWLDPSSKCLYFQLKLSNTNGSYSHIYSKQLLRYMIGILDAIKLGLIGCLWLAWILYLSYICLLPTKGFLFSVHSYAISHSLKQKNKAKLNSQCSALWQLCQGDNLTTFSLQECSHFNVDCISHVPKQLHAENPGITLISTPNCTFVANKGGLHWYCSVYQSRFWLESYNQF